MQFVAPQTALQPSGFSCVLSIDSIYFGSLPPVFTQTFSVAGSRNNLN